MATPLYLTVQKLVDDSWVNLDREQITPWAFMNAGPTFKCTDYYGKEISYSGVEFSGSPCDVFWGRYIEPFIENIVQNVVVETLRLSVEKKQNPEGVQNSVSGS